MIPFSILDLSPITEGSDAQQSFRNSLDLARHAESWGYNRFWLAEHHGMPGIASAATSVLIGHVAAGTKTIRVGSGGVMLPNHSPLVIAEQFGTLECLFPGRIDLGLGRAPGSDQITAQALRRNLAAGAESFPQDVLELLEYFSESPKQPVRAVPGTTPRDRLLRLAVGERTLIENAASAESRFSLRRHLEGVTANLIGGAAIATFGDSGDAVRSTLIGIAIGEAEIWSQPWRATGDLRDYHAQFPGSPGLSNIRCRSCNGTGEAHLPHGSDGRRLVNYMDASLHAGRDGLKKRLHNTGNM